MILILSADEDPVAAWACRVLSAYEPVHWVRPATLRSAREWTLDGGPRLVLEDGRCIEGQKVRATLNRLHDAPDPAFAHQWIASLPGPVLNRPQDDGLCGARSAASWRALATSVGLPVVGPAVVPVATAQALVIGEKVLGPLVAHDWAEELVALARKADTGCLGVSFVRTPDGWGISGFNPAPDMRRGGDLAARALVQTLGLEA